MSTKKLVLLVSTVAYPVVVHLSIVFGKPTVGFIALLALMLVHTLYTVFSGGLMWRAKLTYLFLVLLIVAGLLFLLNQWGPEFPLFIPPVAIGVFLCLFFFKSLLPGQTPVITYVSKICRVDSSPEIDLYTRKLTIFWTIVMAVLPLEAVLLALFAPIEIWSLFTNILNYIFIGVLFFGEYIFRRYIFQNHNHTSPIRMVRDIARQGIFSKPDCR